MDHYKTLGVAKNATPDEIKKAYRKLASQHHPDKGGDTAMFQKVEEAYRILSDPQKRQEYDNPSRPFNFPNFDDPSGFSFNVNGADFGDIFGQMFGHRNSPFGQRSNQQVFRTQVSITLEDAYYGVGQVMKLQTHTGQKVINLNVPKGVKESTQAKYDNIIDNGVLLVEFRIAPHLKFERRGNDLYCNQPISILDLIVGTTVDFTTISGKTFEVTVPPKTQPYMQLKIAGQGMPIQGTNAYGDQILLLKPYLPDNISDEITQSIMRTKAK